MIQININDIGNKVRNTLLTGLNTALTGIITATDTVLQAFGKLQNQITSLTQTVDSSVIYEWTPTSVFTQGQKFIWQSPFGDYRIYVVNAGFTLNAGETPFTHPDKVELINNNWMYSSEIHRWHPTNIYWNFTRVLGINNSASSSLTSATPILGNGQTITELVIRIHSAQTAGSKARLSLYEFTGLIIGTAAYTAKLIHDGGTVATDGAQGKRTAVIPPTTLKKGMLYFAVLTNTNTSGSYQSIMFDLSFLGFGVNATNITRYYMFVANTIANASITDASNPAQANIKLVPVTSPLPVTFVR